MRVLIDLQGSQTESRFRGIGRYSLSLVQAMARNAGDHEIWVALNGAFPAGITEIETALDGLVPTQRIRRFNTFAQVGWHVAGEAWPRVTSEYMWEAFLDGVQPDVIHTSSLFEGAQGMAVSSIGKLPNLKAANSVTLYDLIPLLNAEIYLASDWVRSWYMDKVESLKRADLLLSISQYAREEALRALDIDPSRLVNMSSAISAHFQPMLISDFDRVKLHERFGIKNRYVMYSGSMEPRKNVEGLLRAFSMLGENLLRDTQLVIAGKISDYDQIKYGGLVSLLGITNNVLFIGYVSDDDLVMLYSATDLYVFPSLHEGFGLPALEAMACGAPTIGSCITSIPEVIGREDALFDPRDPIAIAQAIRRVLESSALSASLREHALRQAKRFSWDNTARTALSAMETVAAKRPVRKRFWPAAGDDQQVTYRQLIKSIAGIDSNPDELNLQNAAALISKGMSANERLSRSGKLPKSLRWRVEGPFDSTYSLALVNRYLAQALVQRGHQIALHSTEGPGDFDPSSDFLSKNPEIAQLHLAASCLPAIEAEISSRLLYPPRVSDVASRINLLHAYAWEESAFPRSWVEDFNDSLQGISCLSEHVRKIMIDNGVAVPLGVCSSGVDHWDNVIEDTQYPVPGKGFRFLHVSSCFPRKGVDVMLEAYGKAFNSDDDVSLVIKTFANPHNEVRTWLDNVRGENPAYPAVHIIEGDISDAQLKHLYSSCNALLAPSRAEGFGLPLAEAMLMGLPVVTTAWGGQLDFCNEKTAWLIDYSFVQAQTHFKLSNSVWAEPDVDELAKALRQIKNAPTFEINARTTAAEELLRSRFKWSDTARRLEEDVRRFASNQDLLVTRTGWISTWNTRCGIASYSKNLVNAFSTQVVVLANVTDECNESNEQGVIRCWNQGEGERLKKLEEEIERLNLNVLIIQFQYSFFDFRVFEDFIRRQKSAGRVIIVVMHATVDPVEHPGWQLRLIADGLAACDRVLAHSIEDLNRLKRIGVERNTALFPHGTIKRIEASPPINITGSLKIASYGFFLPHKGLYELVDAVAILVERGMDVKLTMVNAEYPVPVSREQIERVTKRIKQHGITSSVKMITEYLQDDQSMAELAKADVVVFPYQGTGESSSAAVRYGLATGKPVAVTPLPIFNNVKEVVYQLPGTAADDIARGLMLLHESLRSADDEFEKKKQLADQWLNEHQYSVLGNRLETMCCQLLRRLQEDM